MWLVIDQISCLYVATFRIPQPGFHVCSSAGNEDWCPRGFPNYEEADEVCQHANQFFYGNWAVCLYEKLEGNYMSSKEKVEVLRAALEEMVRVFAAYEEFPVETQALETARAALGK